LEFIAGEGPQHRVRITRAFYLGLCEVTQGQYAQVVGTNPSHFKDSGRDAPVEQVSWEDAVAFCRRLSELQPDKVFPGEYRLPTEAEWEYACRAGTTTAYSSGDDEAGLLNCAWCPKNSAARTHPVGLRNPNRFGLYDMQGNVLEWCWDASSPDYYRQSPTADPPGPTTRSGRVLRGGSWCLDPADLFLRCAFRAFQRPDFRYGDIGFRVVRTLPAQTTSRKETSRLGGSP